MNLGLNLERKTRPNHQHAKRSHSTHKKKKKKTTKIELLH